MNTYRNVCDVTFDQIGQTAEQATTFRGRQQSPWAFAVERAYSRLHGQVDVLLESLADLDDLLAGHR